jgi:hypothetical protein
VPLKVVVAPAPPPPPPPPPVDGGGGTPGVVVGTPGIPVVPRQHIWTAPTGESINLTAFAGGYAQAPERDGFGAPPVDLQWDDLPAGGSVLRQSRPLMRTLGWVQHVLGSSQADREAKWGRLVDVFMASVEQPGKLTVQQFDGRRRFLMAHYVDGLEGAESRSTWSGQHVTTPLRVMAPNPYFLAEDESKYVVGMQPEETPFYNPDGFFPVRLAAGGVTGTFDVVNPGDREVWPWIGLRGPGTAIAITNETLGKTITVTQELLIGQGMSIDTETATITGPNGAPWRRYIAFPGASGFPLRKGTNRLRVQMLSASEESNVTVRFRARYNTP